MTVKSVISIPVDDEQFRKFAELFEKHRKAVSRLPDQWKKVAQAANETVEGAAAAMLANQELASKQVERIKANSHATSSYWANLAKSSRSFASNISAATASLLKWSSIAGVVSGLVGAGGLFGIDRLALGVASGRRASMGLGVGYGARQAFGVNFGRLVDSDSFLGSVNASLHDLTQRYRLYGAGLTDKDLQGDTYDVAVRQLSAIRNLVRSTDPASLAQVLQSRGLDQQISLSDAMRLRSTSDAEFKTLLAGAARDRRTLGLSDDTQRRWQDFSTQLSRAGRQIENVFVRGLTPLVGPLERLSTTFTALLAGGLENLAKSGAIDKFGQGIRSVANWLGDPSTQAALAANTRLFIQDTGAMATAIHNALVTLGIVKDGHKGIINQAQDVLNYTPGDAVKDVKGSAWFKRLTNSDPNRRAAWWDPGSWASRNGGLGSIWNNIGNLRPVGATSGFRSFPTLSAGINALASDLRYKENVRGLDTIAKIISRYAPPGENDTAAYIKDVARFTGIGANQHLNLASNDVLSRLIAAISRHEGRRAVTPQIVLKVISEPGSKVAVSTAQLPH